MRTAIFLLALSVEDIANSIRNKDISDGGVRIYAVLLVSFVVMDVVDFLR